MAVPEPQSVATYAEVEGLGADAVTAYHITVGLLQVDAEEAVVQRQILDRVVMPAHIQAGVIRIVRLTRAGNGEITYRCLVGLDDEHSPLVTTIHHHLALSNDGQRLVQQHWSCVSPGRDGQLAAGRCGIDQSLQGLQAMNPLVPQIQRNQFDRLIDIHPCHAGLGTYLGAPGFRRKLHRIVGRTGEAGEANTPRRQQQGATQCHSALPSLNCLRRIRMAGTRQTVISNNSA